MSRAVVGQMSLTLDGRVSGPGGPEDMGPIAGYAGSDVAHERAARTFKSATTALLGRKNYEGFHGYWPSVQDDESADERDRALSRSLDDIEKVVFSTTMTEAPWVNSRIAEGGPVEEVRRLRDTDGGDILVVNSVSVMRQLLDAGELDRLLIDLCPEIVGGGEPLFEDGLPKSTWTLTEAEPADDGAICLTYDRIRD